MKVFSVLLILSIGENYVWASSGSGNCCSELEVEGVKYKFKEMKDTSKYNCRDNCVYMNPSNSTAEYCFGFGSTQSVCTGGFGDGSSGSTSGSGSGALSGSGSGSASGSGSGSASGSGS